MNLNFYKDETEKDIRQTLENLYIEAEEFSYLASQQEVLSEKELYLSKARERKFAMKWLVKTLYEKNPLNNLLEGISKEIDQAQKMAKDRDNTQELKRLAHIKNLIRKGRWLSTKKPTIVKASEFVC